MLEVERVAHLHLATLWSRKGARGRALRWLSTQPNRGQAAHFTACPRLQPCYFDAGAGAAVAEAVAADPSAELELGDGDAATRPLTVTLGCGVAVMAIRCCLPFVPRAARVADAFALAITRVSPLTALRGLGGEMPSAVSAAVLPSKITLRAATRLFT